MTVGAKICGLTHRDDVRLADELGADYLGFVVSAGFGRSLPAEEARAISEGVSARRVAVLVDERVDEAASIGSRLGADVLQLHGDEPPEQLEALRARGEWDLWKAVRAASPGDVRDAVRRYASVADALVVEGRREGVTGGGGARLELPPDSVRRLLPDGLVFVLAGGLTPETVDGAVARYRPDVVDVSSGVGAGPRRKDPARVRSFLEAVRAAPAYPARADSARATDG